MYNNVTAVGFLVADPETRQTSKDTVTKLRVGISPSRAKERCFIDLEYWGKTAEIAAQYLTKGREFLFTGELAVDSWEDKKTGEKRTKYFIRGKDLQFLNSGKKDDGSAAPSNGNSSDDTDSVPF